MNTGIKTADPDWSIALNPEMPTKTPLLLLTFLVFNILLLTIVRAQNLHEIVDNVGSRNILQTVSFWLKKKSHLLSIRAIYLLQIMTDNNLVFFFHCL